METTRKQIADRLRAGPATAADIAAELSVSTSTVYDHLEHVSRSAVDDESFLVSPPTCRDCGFDGFDDRLNAPSRCPACKSERVEQPAFVIR